MAIKQVCQATGVDLEVGGGSAVVVKSGADLSCESGSTTTLAGQCDVTGQMDVSGDVTIVTGGTVTADAGSDVEVNGELTIANSSPPTANEGRLTLGLNAVMSCSNTSYITGTPQFDGSSSISRCTVTFGQFCDVAFNFSATLETNCNINAKGGVTLNSSPLYRTGTGAYDSLRPGACPKGSGAIVDKVLTDSDSWVVPTACSAGDGVNFTIAGANKTGRYVIRQADCETQGGAGYAVKINGTAIFTLNPNATPTPDGALDINHRGSVTLEWDSAAGTINVVAVFDPFAGTAGKLVTFL